MLSESTALCQAKETLAPSKIFILDRSYTVVFREAFNKSSLVYQCISSVLCWQGCSQAWINKIFMIEANSVQKYQTTYSGFPESCKSIY